MTAPMLGPGQRDLIHRLAARRKGITRSECALQFQTSYHATWRTFERLVREGRIFPTDLRRRDIFGFARRPSVIFKAHRPRSWS